VTGPSGQAPVGATPPPPPEPAASAAGVTPPEPRRRHRETSRLSRGARHFDAAIGRLLRLLMALGILGGVGIAALAWRLEKAPLDLPWRAAAVQQLLDEQAGAVRIRIGGMSVAWAGWREGHLSPLALRVTEVEIADAADRHLLSMPVAEVELSFPALLRGEVLPSSVDLDSPALTLRRMADGGLALDLGDLLDDAEAEGSARAALDALLYPPPGTLLAELRRVRLRSGRALVRDTALGVDWSVDALALTLRRRGDAGVTLDGAATLHLGDAQLPVQLAGVQSGGIGEPHLGTLRVEIAQIRPSDIAANLMASTTPLALALVTALNTVDAPLSLAVTATAEDQLPLRLAARLGLGAGRLGPAVGPHAAIAGGEASLSGTPDRIRLSEARLRLAPVSREAGAMMALAPTVTLSGEVWRDGTQLRAGGEVGLDRVPIGDLAAYWPPGLAGGARDWVLENVSGGTASDGRWRIEAEATETLSDLRVTGASGTLALADATVHWLRPMPPVERAAGTITFGRDEVLVQAHGVQGGIEVREVSARFFELMQPQELAEIHVRTLGSIAEMVSLIRHPRLKLFEHRPLELNDPAGRAEVVVDIAFPLLADLPVERVDVHASAHLTQARLADVLLGRGIEGGTFDLTVDTDALRATGTATLASIPIRATVQMDFRRGPASQVIERATVEARGEARLLAGLGLDVDAVASGPMRIEAQSERRRNGQGRVTLNADLSQTHLFAEPLAWNKPPGATASLEAVLTLAGKELSAVDSFVLTAPALFARGRVAVGPGARLERVELAQVTLFAGRFAADVRPPAAAGQPWRIGLRGTSFDAAPILAAPASASASASTSDPPLLVDVRLDRLLLGPGRSLINVAGQVRVDSQGAVQQAQVTGAVPPRAAIPGGTQGDGAGAFEANVTPATGGRRLRLTSENAGGLLRALDVVDSLEGGKLSVTGRWDGGLLTGDATMEDFAMHGMPGFGKVLQGLTLYGLVDALRGPGLHFDQMVAPFTLRSGQLTLLEARAYSSSLGVTARGWVDSRQQRLDLRGTIVPAYLFNSLLGNLPLIGRLFSLESGGGLFAATFAMTGALADPQVSVNPLAALTPGFLRGLFGSAPQPAPEAR